MGKHVVVVAAAAAALALASSALASPLARFFQDPAGDSGTAPDITSVDVGNDVVRGPIVFWVATPNRTAYANADGLGIYLDTDLRGDTGETRSGGAEYVIGADGAGAQLFKWDGTMFAQVAAPTLDADFVASEKAMRVAIHPSDLAGTRGFNFFVLGFDAGASDVAPDGDALWTYALESGPLVLTKEGARTTAARAGKPYAVALVVGREDTNEILTEGRVTCALKLGKTVLRSVLARFVDDVATCGWRLPRTAAGKKLTARITASYGGASVSHSAAAVVRK